MSNTPEDLRYAASHEWVRVEEDGTVTVGISDHAQELLGDIVYVDLPEVGDTFGAEDEASEVESVKAASEVYAPIAGEIIAINELLADAPETVNGDAYGDGWFFKMKPNDIADVEKLMSASDYKASL